MYKSTFAWINWRSHCSLFFPFFPTVIDRYGERLEEGFHSTAARHHSSEHRSQTFEGLYTFLCRDAEQSGLTQELVQLADTSSHSTGKWARCAGKRCSVPGESSTCIGFAGKIGGEASSASPISSSSAAKVGMVVGAESHAVSHKSAAPNADGVVASIRNSLMPLGLEDEEMIQAAQKAVGHRQKALERRRLLRMAPYSGKEVLG